MIPEKRDHCRPHQTKLETVKEGTEIHPWTSQAHQIGDEEGARCRMMSGLGEVVTGSSR